MDNCVYNRFFRTKHKADYSIAFKKHNWLKIDSERCSGHRRLNEFSKLDHFCLHIYKEARKIEYKQRLELENLVTLDNIERTQSSANLNSKTKL